MKLETRALETFSKAVPRADEDNFFRQIHALAMDTRGPKQRKVVGYFLLEYISSHL